MKQRPRIYYTESQKKLMWDHWQKGDSLQHIAQLFERNHSSIQRILAETGRNCLGSTSIFNVGAQVEILRIPVDSINHFFPWLDVGRDSFDRDTST